MNAQQYKTSARNSGIVTSICFLAWCAAFLLAGQRGDDHPTVGRVLAWLLLSTIIGSLVCIVSSALAWFKQQREHDEKPVA